MQRKILLGIFISVLFISTGTYAAAPAEGVVIEGVSVPGIELGAPRAQVEAAYGAPSYCQSVTYGDRAVCTFPVTGGGQISVRYFGPEGGNAGNSPYDMVHSVTWYSGVDWVTSAGATAEIAQNDPDQLPLLYPNAELTYHGFTGQLFRVVDSEQGISITRFFNFYTGRTTVYLTIFPGQ